MVSSEDQAIGAAIRRRREAAGIQQQTLAAAVGLAPGVMGRVELGTRSCRATELRIIAKELGISTDELLRDVVPVSTAELVERAAFRRDVAYKSLREYAESLAVAMRGVTDEEVVILDDGDTLSSPADVREHMAHTQPPFADVTVEKSLVPDIAAALDTLRASLVIGALRPPRDLSNVTMGELEGVSDE